MESLKSDKITEKTGPTFAVPHSESFEKMLSCFRHDENDEFLANPPVRNSSLSPERRAVLQAI